MDLVGSCTGQVLEIGVGAGANLPLYTKAAQVIAIDSSEKMLQEAENMARRASLPVVLYKMDARALDFSTDSFDTIVATFVFCSVPDPVSALKEVHRVLKPSGRFIVVEHVDTQNPGWQVVLRALRPPLKLLAGCDRTRDTVKNIAQAGLVINQVDRIYADFVLQIGASKT